jgi:hypothetical protein
MVPPPAIQIVAGQRRNNQYPYRRLAHSVHQLASAGAARRRQIVAGMAEIMEMESSRQAGS